MKGNTMTTENLALGIPEEYRAGANLVLATLAYIDDARKQRDAETSATAPTSVDLLTALATATSSSCSRSTS